MVGLSDPHRDPRRAGPGRGRGLRAVPVARAPGPGIGVAPHGPGCGLTAGRRADSTRRHGEDVHVDRSSTDPWSFCRYERAPLKPDRPTAAAHGPDLRPARTIPPQEVPQPIPVRIQDPVFCHKLFPSRHLRAARSGFLIRRSLVRVQPGMPGVGARSGRVVADSGVCGRIVARRREPG